MTALDYIAQNAAPTTRLKAALDYGTQLEGWKVHKQVIGPHWSHAICLGTA